MRISDWSSDVCSSDLKGKPERGRAFGPAIKQEGLPEMLVPFRPRPHRRQRNHVSEIERRDRRLPDIGVDMARQRAKPGVGGVERLRSEEHTSELQSLMRNSYTVFCLTQKIYNTNISSTHSTLY